MPNYLDRDGVAYLWSKIKRESKNKLVYHSKTEAEWKQETGLIGEKDVLYLYSDYKTIQSDGKIISIPGVKIGDGESYLIDLPFLNNTSELEDMLLDHINNKVIHVSLEDRFFWDNKLNYQMEESSQILTFNRQ